MPPKALVAKPKGVPKAPSRTASKTDSKGVPAAKTVSKDAKTVSKKGSTEIVAVPAPVDSDDNKNEKSAEIRKDEEIRDESKEADVANPAADVDNVQDADEDLDLPIGWYNENIQEQIDDEKWELADSRNWLQKLEKEIFEPAEKHEISSNDKVSTIYTTAKKDLAFLPIRQLQVRVCLVDFVDRCAGGGSSSSSLSLTSTIVDAASKYDIPDEILESARQNVSSSTSSESKKNTGTVESHQQRYKELDELLKRGSIGTSGMDSSSSSSSSMTSLRYPFPEVVHKAIAILSSGGENDAVAEGAENRRDHLLNLFGFPSVEGGTISTVDSGSNTGTVKDLSESDLIQLLFYHLFLVQKISIQAPCDIETGASILHVMCSSAFKFKFAMADVADEKGDSTRDSIGLHAIQFLLNLNADPAAPDRHGLTPLMYTVRKAAKRSSVGEPSFQIAKDVSSALLSTPTLNSNINSSSPSSSQFDLRTSTNQTVLDFIEQGKVGEVSKEGLQLNMWLKDQRTAAGGGAGMGGTAMGGIAKAIAARRDSAEPKYSGLSVEDVLSEANLSGPNGWNRTG